MARGANRRKLQEAKITIASTAVSGSTGDSENAANADTVTYYVDVTTATVGSLTLTIDISQDDGANWFPLTSGEVLGNTGALTLVGNYRIASSRVASIGFRSRLTYTIVTGPFAFTVDPVFEKSGGVF